MGGDDAEVRAAAEAWPGLRILGTHPGATRRHVRVGELDGRRVVVRRSRHGGDALAWQLDLLEELSAAGVGVPSTVPTADGRRHADGLLVEEHVAGAPPDGEEAWTRAAAAVATLHRVTTGHDQRPGAVTSADLQHAATGGDVDLGAMPDEVASALRGVWRALPPSPGCVVHGALSSRRILVDGDDVVIVDWDAARVDHPWFDLAALPAGAWPEGGDVHLARAAGLAWATASAWRTDPGEARRRLLELRDGLSGPVGDELRPEDLHAEVLGSPSPDG